MAGESVSIVIPTWKEHDNLRLLMERISAAMTSRTGDWEVIIVDDDSQDGSEALAAELSEEYPLLFITRKGERGLSSAVLHGFTRAKNDVLVVMDADLSHPADTIPTLVQAVTDEQADFAIGSRYVEGGRTEDWSFLRYLNSLAATLPARLLTSVKDPMSGFFALRREIYERADVLNPIGYKIGLELIVKCRCRVCVERPITFANRTYGSSKLTFKEQMRYLRHLGRLYCYCLFGRKKQSS